MKKNIKALFLIIAILMMGSFPLKVRAADTYISVYTSASTYIVGNTITATVTLSSSSALGAWEFDLAYDSNELSLTSSTAESGGTRFVGGVTNSSTYKKTYTLKFRAKASGYAKIEIKNAYVLGYNETNLNASKGSKTVRVMTQSELESTYSKDNYLESLTSDKGEFTEEFDKEVSNYTLTLEPETELITISGSVNDSKSSVTGLGEIDVTDGENEIEIVVTAQNGSQRKYTVTAIVEELNPVIVSTDDEDKTIVRKTKDVECPSNYDPITLTYGEEEIPACYSEITDYNLILLKDSEGETDFYIYKDDSFTLYKELNFGKFSLFPIFKELTKITDTYKQKEVEIDGIKVMAYQSDLNSNYSLIYGMNINTGEENIYLYDDKEGTAQRYFDEELDDKDEKIKTYYTIIIASLVAFAILITTNVIIALKIKKNLKKGVKKDFEATTKKAIKKAKKQKKK